VKNNIGGRMKGAVMLIGGLRKNDAEKKSVELQIKNGSGWKTGAVLRSATVFDEECCREATPISERVACERALMEKKRAPVIAGLIVLR
jgi:hypothetical protein